MFDENQIKLLKSPLNKEYVRERQQSGRSLSYIEGWHAISEANRIFGFDGWHRETIDMRLVSERPRKIGRDGKDGWSVSYMCRTRIVVGDIIRDGCGSGHGIDADVGLAHESALKEAETDAMKRALMTFGNPFGLALYDKTQAMVVDIPVVKEVDENDTEKMISMINTLNTSSALKKWWRETAKFRESLGIVEGSPAFATIWDEFVKRGKQLASTENING